MESKQLCCVLAVSLVFFVNRDVYSIPVAEVLNKNGSTTVVPLGEVDVDNLTENNATTNGTQKDL